MKKSVKNIIIIILVISSFIVYYYLTGNITYSRVSVNVTRVIDGDTIVIEGGEHIRLLGINTPEKDNPFHDEATNYLNSLIGGKQVEIERHTKDKYSRTLGYIFFNNEIVNKKQLEHGFANLYYYGTDKYYNEMKKAEESAGNNEIGIWKKSLNFGCLRLVKLEYLDGGKCNNQEQLVLNNNCNPMNVIIKDDANHIYGETINTGLFVKNFSCIWNDDGDTVYVRDDSGLLLWYRY